MTTSHKLVIIVVCVFAVVGIVVGYYIYQNSLQPNIQVTDIDIGQALKNPQTAVVLNLGRVSNSGTFSYTTTLSGSYTLVFSNSFSIISSKSVSVMYSAAGKSDTQSLVIPPGTYRTITVNLATNQVISGSFTASGGSGNDVDFYIESKTGTQSFTLNFTLVNSGTANGFADVILQADGKEVWSNRYFVQAGQQIRQSERISLPDLDEHILRVMVLQQQKA